MQDELYLHHLTDACHDAVRRLLGPRKALLWNRSQCCPAASNHPKSHAHLAYKILLEIMLWCDRETALAAQLLYHGSTTGCGVQTLGEEYCDILQVNGNDCVHDKLHVQYTLVTQTMYDSKTCLGSKCVASQVKLALHQLLCGGACWSCCRPSYHTWQIAWEPKALRMSPLLGCSLAMIPFILEFQPQTSPLQVRSHNCSSCMYSWQHCVLCIYLRVAASCAAQPSSGVCGMHVDQPNQHSIALNLKAHLMLNLAACSSL